MSDGLAVIIAKVIEENPKYTKLIEDVDKEDVIEEDVEKGVDNSIKYLLNQILQDTMKATKGKADPKRVLEAIDKYFEDKEKEESKERHVLYELEYGAQLEEEEKLRNMSEEEKEAVRNTKLKMVMRIGGAPIK